MSVGTSLDRHIAVVRTGVLAGSLIFAFGLFGSSPALAQNCGMAGPLIAPAAAWSAGIAISNAITAANTAFLGQSTAFVSAPGNPKANSEGAGIWIRGVGGELTTNSSAHVVQAITTAPNRTLFFSGPCNDQFHQTFGGFQLGTDMAKLNVGGWNLTLGPTAGFLQTNGNIVGGNSVLGTSPFNSTTQAPFVGTYGHASYGNFFVDGIVRADYFQTVLNSPAGSQLILNPVSGALVPTAAINFANQRVDTHGFTVAASTGYNWQVPNSSWFIEPSAGVIWSREAVDPFGVAGQTGALTSTPQNPNVFASGTVKVNDIESIMGRAGLRVGTTMETSDVVYSPFVAASVWHDFGSRITTNWGLCPGCDFGMPVTSSMS
ncbi:MAG: autotransporter outer membrane beta-barrel domain-containing protein, partial [Bradyrhizobiaceae bacterium]|nr:autotransporter outer membrane beta-barrel domain-containing protein [Bradyrhizobiaceae bacterium]